MTFLVITQFDGVSIDLNFEHVLAITPVDAKEPQGPAKLVFSVPGVQPLVVKQSRDELHALVARARFGTVPK